MSRALACAVAVVVAGWPAPSHCQYGSNQEPGEQQQLGGDQLQGGTGQGSQGSQGDGPGGYGGGYMQEGYGDGNYGDGDGDDDGMYYNGYQAQGDTQGQEAATTLATTAAASAAPSEGNAGLGTKFDMLADMNPVQAMLVCGQTLSGGGPGPDALACYGVLGWRGYAPAQLALGVSHFTTSERLSGDEAEQAVDTAIAWFSRAAVQGSVEAQFRLSLALTAGRDHKAALCWATAANTASAATRDPILASYPQLRAVHKDAKAQCSKHHGERGSSAAVSCNPARLFNNKAEPDAARVEDASCAALVSGVTVSVAPRTPCHSVIDDGEYRLDQKTFKGFFPRPQYCNGNGDAYTTDTTGYDTCECKPCYTGSGTRCAGTCLLVRAAREPRLRRASSLVAAGGTGGARAKHYAHGGAPGTAHVAMCAAPRHAPRILA